ncbi:MPT synthase sulfurylase, putative [Candida dubliniensis CD36]|uniref:Needs CLA4 to survive protein 3 n=1 Tax=Candida dubliniensis (strain CD36 / ATCC MYA-646 / CBS 7987 / NCPF 3949 / NRRL Y-17841) TaxID=573826 RepID=B9W999_CANDC|nr:MPT synthase sulfurylase, putative [Candida dubliniensis CD36]CAX45373.1 MPT synthase sulfurylase, putative [Candida dubliniensis CD36]
MSEPSKEELLAKIAQLEFENNQLKQQQHGLKSKNEQFCKIDENFSLDEYKRYGRQMIVPQFGSLESQIKLKNSKVLVVGAGGLGSPALLYLSSAGIGTIGIIDHDTVDTSNLHRQVIHNTEMVGEFKCISAQNYIKKLNPHVIVDVYPTTLSNDNAFDIISQYDLVLDCTDHPAVRYLINDVCVLLGKTIVSGSGLKSDGQLTVLNFANSGPCYRCFYPQPPSPASVTSCSDGGVIGPAIGLVGVAMAVETIKIITGYYTKDNFVPFLTSYSGYPQQQLRAFKMRKRQKDCAVCGENPQISRRIIEDGTINYKTFCGRVTFDPIDDKFRISPKDYDRVVQNKQRHILLDVRPREQFQITHLPNAINVQWDPVFRKADTIQQYLPEDSTKDNEIYVVCRFGNDSQLAAKKLLDLGYSNVRDIIGGLDKWSDDVDSKIPKY